MNLELGRSVGSTEVSPFISSLEQVGGTESACFSSLSLVPVGLARGPYFFSLSPSRVDLTIPDEHCSRSPACSRQMLEDQRPCTGDRGCRIVSVEIVVLLSTFD